MQLNLVATEARFFRAMKEVIDHGDIDCVKQTDDYEEIFDKVRVESLSNFCWQIFVIGIKYGHGLAKRKSQRR